MSKNEEYDYEGDISIDIDALDVEWLNQANVYWKYSKACADARNEMDTAYQNAKVAEASIGQQMRTDPEQFGLKKSTEGAVADAMKTHKEVVDAREAHLEAKYNYEVLLSAVRSLEMKKEALENLVRLSQQDYFTLPSEPRETGQIKEKLKEKTKETNAKVREAMNKKDGESKQ